MKAAEALRIAQQTVGHRVDVSLYHTPESGERAIRISGNLCSTCKDAAFVIFCELRKHGVESDYTAPGPYVYVWF